MPKLTINGQAVEVPPGATVRFDVELMELESR